MKVPVLARPRRSRADDRMGGLPVVVINNALAQSYFSGQDPVGQRIAFDKVPDDKSVWRTIVGVVGDEHQSGARAPRRRSRFSNRPTSSRSGRAIVLLKTTGDPVSLAPAVRQIVRDLDPSLAIVTSRPMTAVRDDSLARARFLTTLLLAFAVVGLGAVGRRASTGCSRSSRATARARWGFGSRSAPRGRRCAGSSFAMGWA